MVTRGYVQCCNRLLGLVVKTDDNGKITESFGLKTKHIIWRFGRHDPQIDVV